MSEDVRLDSALGLPRPCFIKPHIFAGYKYIKKTAQFVRRPAGKITKVYTGAIVDEYSADAHLNDNTAFATVILGSNA